MSGGHRRADDRTSRRCGGRGRPPPAPAASRPRATRRRVALVANIALLQGSVCGYATTTPGFAAEYTVISALYWLTLF
ncbi:MULTISPECIES: hypothetical protein [Actinoalloteichus]|uniref:hypothetical protein n=1 Tax=Actinoalloteichus TaxID=65496 RepID=UPI00095299B2|nr:MULTISPECIES: hypothetical protein [Actinoalloteichus]